MVIATTNRFSNASGARVTQLVISARKHYTAGRFREAEAICRQVLEEHGDWGAALHLLGLIAGRTSRLTESAEFLRRAVKSCPNTPEFRSDLGVTLERLGDFKGAIECYRRVLANGSFVTGHLSLAQTLTNLANALLHNGQIDEAQQASAEAVRLNPGYAPAHNALGCILLEQNKAREACETFRKAIELWPDFNEAKSNLGRALLTLGQFPEGWHYFGYLNHTRIPRHVGRSLEQLLQSREGQRDRWTEGRRGKERMDAGAKDNGRMTKDKELFGKTVLLYGEGGLGNIIQFARYATLLAQRGARVVFESPACLVNLLKTVPGIDQVIADGEVPPTYHFHASIMDLPRIFGTMLDTVPATIPYLSADPELVAEWRERLSHSNSAVSNQHSAISRRVGICWQAEQRTSYGRQRTIPLAHFAVLSQVPGVQLISLQKGWTGSAAFPLIHFPDLDETRGAFMDSAAIMKHLDLVITADTSIAHLAGALGVPVWVAVRHLPDWRWMLGRTDSPWYPTMRLFRQATPGVWREVFEAMAKELGN